MLAVTPVAAADVRLLTPREAAALDHRRLDQARLAVPLLAAAPRYVAGEQGNPWHAVRVRTDGRVDRVTPWNAKTPTTHACPDRGVHYVAAAAATGARTFFLRSDGKVDMWWAWYTEFRHVGTLAAPEDQKFTQASASEWCAYLLTDAGRVYSIRYTTSDRRKTPTLTEVAAPGGAANKAGLLPPQYVQISGGLQITFLLAQDGRVFFTANGGRRVRAFTPPDAGVRYTAVSSQMRDPSNPNPAVYAVREDGGVDRVPVTFFSKPAATKTYPPPAGDGIVYVAAAAGADASYLLRSDGAVDRISGWKLRTKTLPLPPPGVVYTDVSVGSWVTLLQRSDGLMDSTSRGKLKKAAIAPKK